MADRSVLLFRIGACVGAVPLNHVEEILRPLHSEPIQDMPNFVLGLSVLRGLPVPVVDVSMLLGENSRVSSGRWVSIRLERRRVALAVEGVLGVRSINVEMLEGMPPLLQKTDPGFLETIGILDSQLLVVLRASRLLSEDAWQALSERGVDS